jgi:hypothetical protein
MRVLIQWFGVAVLIGAQIPENVEQSAQGTRPPAAIVESFDRLGAGFAGPQGAATYSTRIGAFRLPGCTP